MRQFEHSNKFPRISGTCFKAIALVLSGFLFGMTITQVSLEKYWWEVRGSQETIHQGLSHFYHPPDPGSCTCSGGVNPQDVYQAQQKHTTPQNGFDQLVPFDVLNQSTIPAYDWDFYYPIDLKGNYVDLDLNKPRRRNVVIGMASGYNYNQVRPFVKSLRQTGYSDDIVLATFIGDVEQGFRDLMKEFDVIVYNLPASFKEHKNKAAIHRYAFYREWIYPYKGNDRFVLISDVRDTFFQQDPFVNTDETFPFGVNIHMIEEGRKETLGANFWNKIKIEPAYGTAIHEYFFDKPIICSGVTMGRGNTMYRYVKYISDEAIEKEFIKDDQGYHNYLYYTGKFDSFGVRAQILGEGAICTVTYIDQLVRDKEGYVLMGPPTVERRTIDPENPSDTKDMYRAPVVHQYDRFDELQRWVGRKWS